MAGQKVPATVWRNILASILSSALFPTPQDDFLDALNVFSDEMRSVRILRQNARIIQNLRLVCRLWNATVLEIHQPRAIFCEISCCKDPTTIDALVLWPSDGVLQRANRLQAAATYDYLRMAWPNGPPFTDVRLYNDARFHGMNVLIVHFDLPGVCPTRILDCAPSLEALSWRFTSHLVSLYIDYMVDSVLKPLLRHQVCQQLTHLELDMGWNALQDSNGRAEFPRLLYLRIYIIGRPRELVGREGISLESLGSFPVLRNLFMQAKIPEKYRKELYAFLTQCSTTLRSLLLKVTWSPTLEAFTSRNFVSKSITPGLWKCFTSLSHFGPGIESLCLDPSPLPASMRPLGLILEHPGTEPSLLKMRVDDCFTSFFRTCHDWQTKEVIFLETWEEAKQSLYEVSKIPMDLLYLPRHIRFYNMLASRGIVALDRDRKPITEEDGVQFLKRLKTHGFDELAGRKRSDSAVE